MHAHSEAYQHGVDLVFPKKARAIHNFFSRHKRARDNIDSKSSAELWYWAQNVIYIAEKMHNTIIYISSMKKELHMLIKTEMKKAFWITLLSNICIPKLHQVIRYQHTKGTSSKDHLKTIEKTLIQQKGE